ncbi:MAG: HNH endonuclease [Acidobacteria bacterium]|nr:HNH endonuclease [Acidobacteriota bacterium]MYH29347.1 HNH endonuclease [Acidobacteriota bacterium]
MATKATRKIYRSRRWAATRREAIRRARYQCERCGSIGIRGGRLEVHHKVALSDGGDPFDLDNLRVLCRTCHFASHGQTERPMPNTFLRNRGRLRRLAALLLSR